ncbi:sensor histidine kinase [Sinobaca sp. H24]|uniref:sensor histidine kinase n=1 Tax=Sinobaca sp. H24 TaxID=2923376 RepID=UPI00207ADAD6|nr:sensor histidine kinase [Sinobaca sp. H24]
MLVLCAAIGFYINVIKPVIDLTKEVEKVGKGDFEARATVNSQDEVGMLNHRFNEMVLEIGHLIDIRYKLQIQKKEAEIKAMQSQINPHFLYNTLDMIRWSARLEHAPKTGESIEHLSRIFRTSLSEGSLFIPLKNEIKNIKSYLELQKEEWEIT